MEEPAKATPISAEPTAANTPPALSSILSDPTLLARIMSAVSAVQGTAPPPPSVQENTAAEQPTQASLPSADALSKLLSDPAMLEMLPKIINLLGPALASAQQPADTALPTLAKPHDPSHDRDNLLLAIKPFLSSERRDAVDTLLRIAKLGEVFKQMK